MKVAVLGAGAVGSMVGGLIKHHLPEVDVLLFARGDHGEAMRRQGGVNLRAPWGETLVRLPVADEASQIADSDHVFITVKSHATDEAMRAVADHLGDATVISIQNGINQRTLGRYVSPERLALGTTATAIEIATPGTIVMQRDGPTVLGPVSPEVPLEGVRNAASLLDRSRLKTSVEQNMLGIQYNKLVFNTLGAASALSASDFLGEAVTYRPWRRAVGIPLQRESLGVLERAGIRLGRIPGGADAFRFRRLFRTFDLPLVGRLAEVAVRKFFNPKPILFSLQHDLRTGKPTEVDFINGEIVQLAAEQGTSAPLNAKVVQLVHQLSQRGGFFSRDEIVSIFRSLQS